jgi:hypothetical protein
MSRRLLLHLVLPSDWERIDSVREAVSRCAVAVFDDEELQNELAMVAAELLENAMKYGTSGNDVLLVVGEEAGTLRVTVTNAVEPDSPHLTALRNRVDWLHGYPDAAEAYQQALAEIYGGNLDGSGLGLVRIAYEGCCAIDCDLTDLGKVTVHARRARPSGVDA